MGVDYRASFGIGFKVSLPYDEENEEDVYIEEILEGIPEGYSYFETGSGNYTGKPNTWYVVIDDIFKDDYENIQQKGEVLQEVLKSLGLEIESKFDVVGGLLIH